MGYQTKSLDFKFCMLPLAPGGSLAFESLMALHDEELIVYTYFKCLLNLYNFDLLNRDGVGRMAVDDRKY